MGCCWGWFLLGCKTKPRVSTTHKLFKGDTDAAWIFTSPAWPSCTDPNYHRFLAMIEESFSGSSQSIKNLATSSALRALHILLQIAGPGTAPQSPAPESQQRRHAAQLTELWPPLLPQHNVPWGWACSCCSPHPISGDTWAQPITLNVPQCICKSAAVSP